MDKTEAQLFLARRKQNPEEREWQILLHDNVAGREARAYLLQMLKQADNLTPAKAKRALAFLESNRRPFKLPEDNFQLGEIMGSYEAVLVHARRRNPQGS